MPLSLDTVDKIHTRLLVRYAGKWLNLYAGIDPGMVKADWAEELGGIHGGRIEHAFQNLPPDNPPNAAQFRALCLLWRPPAPKALPAPKPDPERSRNGLARLNEALAGIGRAQANRKRLQWAYDLQERDKAGDDLTARQRADYKHALARYAPIQHGDMTPVPIEALPPAMRAEAEQRRKA
jgi:hypothetical protein